MSERMDCTAPDPTRPEADDFGRACEMAADAKFPLERLVDFDKVIALRVAFDGGARWSREYTRLAVLIHDPVIKLLEEAASTDAQSHAICELGRILQLIYPDVESCDCEAPCSCKYPAGWLALKDLVYHHLGTATHASEALAALAKARGEAHADRN